MTAADFLRLAPVIVTARPAPVPANPAGVGGVFRRTLWLTFIVGTDEPDPEPENENDPAPSRRFKEIIEGSGELIGALGGSAVGLLGGPIGSLAGAAAGVAITRVVHRVGVEVYDRLMVNRQQQRVGATLAFAAEDAARNNAEGKAARSDGFFDVAGGRRSDADEVLEGILLAAANSYQEFKLRHLGAILPNLAVRPDVSPADGHWLTRMADRLTWRQLLVIAIYIDPPISELRSRDTEQNELGRRHPSSSLREEVEELGALGLLGVLSSSGEIFRPGGTWGTTGSIWAAGLDQLRLTDQGRLLSEIARLDDVPPSEAERVTSELIG